MLLGIKLHIYFCFTAEGSNPVYADEAEAGLRVEHYTLVKAFLVGILLSESQRRSH